MEEEVAAQREMQAKVDMEMVAGHGSFSRSIEIKFFIFWPLAQ